MRAALSGLAVWLGAAAAVSLLAPRLGTGLSALLLVAAAALSARWWPLRFTGPALTLAVLAFNWSLLPPRHSLRVERTEDLALLGGLLLVGWWLAALVRRLQALAAQAGQQAQHSERLHHLVAALQQGAAPAAALQAALQQASGRSEVAIGIGAPLQWWGACSEAEAQAARDALSTGSALGPGTGRHEELPRWVLPLRGRAGGLGVALVPPHAELPQALELTAQAALVMEREQAEAAARAAQAQTQEQALRSTLLAALAHDHRTPLASILGAASSLREQGERLSPARREALAAQICAEAEALQRIADNTLQLARLESLGSLQLDWESAEELVGSVLRRLRERDPTRRVKAYVQPDLPLLRCDAVLVVQLLDNLLDNALRHGGDGAVELRAERAAPEPGAAEALRLAVLDRGPGLALADRQRVFEPFQRGARSGGRGSGVGLALGRAVAAAHGGQLRWRARDGGGSQFEAWLPLSEEPAP